jgi:hypothetical protein
LSEPKPVPGSFRDPSGFVFERDGNLYRQVNRSFADAFDRLNASGLYEALVGAGLLIPHREVSADLAVTVDAYRILRPERVRFVSYPYEWCFGQLKDAALTTLRAQRLALDHGMTLRDASAFNVQFQGGRPILIDSLSLEPVREGEPWQAYAQFCQHFLAPLALMSRRDVRLGQLLRTHLDGVPLDLAARLLPRRAKLKPSVWLHLVAHGRAQARHAGDGRAGGGRTGGFSMRAFRGLIDSLERAVLGLDWEPPRSVWADYYGECRTYPAEAQRRKEEMVAAFLDDAGPGQVWDLGANTGRFSRLASSRGVFTLSLDSDHGVVERSYRETVAAEDRNLLPLVIDLANPSPAIGWGNEERMTLAERGPADLVMALALLHHLAIGNNVPLERVAGFLAELGRSLVVEWVPREDPQVLEMLSTRRDAFAGYTPEGFERAFGERFEVLRREELPGSGRVLYLMRRRG